MSATVVGGMLRTDQPILAGHYFRTFDFGNVSLSDK
jgi:hypothetical protein